MVFGDFKVVIVQLTSKSSVGDYLEIFGKTSTAFYVSCYGCLGCGTLWMVTRVRIQP